MVDLKKKNLLIIGLGKSGLAAARLALKRGALVTVHDDKPRAALRAVLRALPRGVRIESGTRRIAPRPYDLIVVSPGVPWRGAFLEKARRAGTPVWSELEFAWRFVTPRSTIAITGTNGKTTTTSMVGALLKAAGRRVLVGGNIGTPLSDLVGRITSRTDLVLEVSSYQLEGHETFKPDVGVIMNITPDHLARHGTMAAYAAAKERLFLNAGPRTVAVLNRRDSYCRRIGARARAKVAWFPGEAVRKLARSLKLPGEHNQENAMAAALAVKAVGVKDAAIRRGLSAFRGVEHRLEWAGRVAGVDYVNDSKATNVDSTLVALKAFDRPLHLILGGEDKGAPYSPLKALIRRKVRRILTIGEAAPLIRRALKGAAPLESCGDMAAAVAFARKTARPGDVVLLSPACASFDQYDNFEERGRHFMSLVKKLR